MIRCAGRRVVAAVWAAGLLLSGGCGIEGPLLTTDTEPIAFELRGRASFEPIVYRAKLGERIKTTPVHPGDAGFLAGATSSQPDECYFVQREPGSDWFQDKVNWAPTLGLFGGVGTDVLKFYAGASVRANTIHLRDGYREGIFSARKQVSDVRPDSMASFVFTRIRPGLGAVIPAAGVRAVLDKLILQAEVGFPYQRWEARSGHDRFGTWQVTQEDTWTGFGLRYAGTVAFRGDDDDSAVFVTAAYEDFNRVKFAGQRAHISGVGVLIGVMFGW